MRSSLAVPIIALAPLTAAWINRRKISTAGDRLVIRLDSWTAQTFVTTALEGELQPVIEPTQRAEEESTNARMYEDFERWSRTNQSRSRTE